MIGFVCYRADSCNSYRHCSAGLGVEKVLASIRTSAKSSLSKPPQGPDIGVLVSDVGAGSGYSEQLQERGRCRRVEQNLAGCDFAVLVVGASLGGVGALNELFAALPRDIPAAILAVLHVGSSSSLPEILNRRGPLPAAHARQGEALQASRIYVAPPDHHMLVQRDSVTLTRGPKVNWSRPAIDPLFHSAAVSFGPSVVGVLLTGRLNDGTVGLGEIKRRGGVAVVQDPADAFCAEMPAGALEHVAVDYSVPLRDMPPLLDRAIRQIVPQETRGRRT